MSDFLGFSSEREYFRLAALRLPRLIQGEPSTSGETPPTLLNQFSVSQCCGSALVGSRGLMTKNWTQLRKN
jgi:hypothetical protein